MAARARTLLVRLSGADPRILRLVPEETPRFAALGGVILMTTALTGVSMLLALTLIVPLWAAVTGAVLWSLGVANLDRRLVIALQRQVRRLRTIALVVARLTFAITLGVITSIPLILWIFKPEIDAELAARGGNAGSGLLAHLDALDAIATRHASADVAQYALLVLFVSISVLPELVQVLRLFGPPSKYDRAAAGEETRARAEVLRNVARTRVEMMGVEREVTDRLAELLITPGPPAEGRAGRSGDEQDGGRS